MTEASQETCRRSDVSHRGPVLAPGDELKSSELYQQYFDLVWRNLKRLGVKPESLEDASHDVFLVAFRRMDDFRGDSSVKTWLFGILLKIAATHRRRAAQERLRAGATEPNEIAGSALSPQEQASQRQALDTFQQLILELTPQHREVFLLVEVEQLAMAEVSKLLKISTNAGYKRLASARASFTAARERARARNDWRTR